MRYVLEPGGEDYILFIYNVNTLKEGNNSATRLSEESRARVHIRYHTNRCKVKHSKYLQILVQGSGVR